MPRAKTKADQIYNARKKAKRLVTRLQNEVRSMTGSMASAARDYIATLSERIAASYSPANYRKMNQTQRDANAQSRLESLQQVMDGMTGRGKAVSQARANKMFERQLNLARLEQPNTLPAEGFENVEGENATKAKYQSAMVDLFYASTKHLWQGADPSDRNKLIMQRLGTDSLSDAFDYVMSRNHDALQDIYEYVTGTQSGEVSDTEEQEWFNQEIGFDSEQQGSEVYLGMMQTIHIGESVG